jgi:hypothetical protein
MSSRQSDSLTRADFFTTTHRISARVQTGPRPLSDLLNDRSQSYLLVFEVVVVPLGQAPGKDRARAPVAYLSKENLSFVVVPSREARPPERGRYAVLEREVLATLPGFEVRGRFLGPLRADLWNFSPATLDPFVVLMEATARIAATPEVTFSGDAILVNRSGLESFCLAE